MEILDPGRTPVNIKAIDEEILDRLAQQSLQIRKDDDTSDLYSKFYRTKYAVRDFSLEEERLAGYLDQLHDRYKDKVRCELQNSEYRWIKVNTSSMDDILYRYYLAPNPNYMHEIVAKLADTFVSLNVAVKFKYQLPQKMDECDRIIIYTDSLHRSQVEDAIKKVYDDNPNLFEGAERAIPWIYPSKTPNVFMAPETPGISYGEAFSSVMEQSKKIFCYLYGMTDTKNRISLSDSGADQAIEYMKLIIGSLLYRNGLLLSNDLEQVRAREQNIRTQYDYKTGALTNTLEDYTGYYRVTFEPTMEGKQALLANFYDVLQVKQQAGVTVSHLSPDERRDEVYEALYGKKSQNYLPVASINNHK